MANSLRALIWGDDYQARHFWMNACNLFFEDTGVVTVAMELGNMKSLDDVGVFFAPWVRDEWGNPLNAEYHQVKFHVTASGGCTWQGLMDPGFINAESVSLLRRLRDDDPAAAVAH